MSFLNDIIFESRLIDLNKAWPYVPKSDQFLPIVIVSSGVKYLESRFLMKL
jgi:hypothetical protein